MRPRADFERRTGIVRIRLCLMGVAVEDVLARIVAGLDLD
jgi:hypothetical protein